MEDKDFEQIGVAECVEEVNRLGLDDDKTRAYFEDRPFTRYDLYNLTRQGLLDPISIKRGKINQYIYKRRDVRLIVRAMQHHATGDYTMQGAFKVAAKELGIDSDSQKDLMEKVKKELEKRKVSFSQGSIQITPQIAEYLLRKLEE